MFPILGNFFRRRDNSCRFARIMSYVIFDFHLDLRGRLDKRRRDGLPLISSIVYYGALSLVVCLGWVSRSSFFYVRLGFFILYYLWGETTSLELLPLTDIELRLDWFRLGWVTRGRLGYAVLG
jgi:hypothetical protein